MVRLVTVDAGALVARADRGDPAVGRVLTSYIEGT